LARPETVMSYNMPAEGSIVLRLEFSIADAVYQRGLLSVLGSAISAWWNRPRLPSNLPAYLREDVGLAPVAEPAHWLDVPSHVGIPEPLRRPGM
jgi:hypothetical protein